MKATKIKKANGGNCTQNILLCVIYSQAVILSTLVKNKYTENIYIWKQLISY